MSKMGVFLVLSAFLAFDTLFARTYGVDSVSDATPSLIQISDGGYALAGSTYNSETKRWGILLLKMNQSWEVEWAEIYADIAHDYFSQELIQTTDGGFAIVGSLINQDMLILRVSPNGVLQWTRTLQGQQTGGKASSLLQTPDGGFLVVGSARIYSDPDSWEFLMWKLSPSGQTEWVKKYGGPGHDFPFTIIRTAEGGYFVAGSKFIPQTGFSDILLLKLSGSGDYEWGGWCYGFGGVNDAIYDAACLVSGDVVCVGTEGAGVGDIVVFVLSPSGDFRWCILLEGKVWSEDEGALSVFPTSDGGFVVAGFTETASAGSYDCLLIKFSSCQSIEWAKIIGWEGWEKAYSVIQTPDGHFVFAGVAYGDWLLVKLDNQGNYPDCARNWTPNVSYRNIGFMDSGIVSELIPSLNVVYPSMVSPQLVLRDICLPYVEIGPEVICYPALGGIVFVSPEDMPVSIYSVDGRMAYSGRLRRGNNSIPLRPGVYLWSAGSSQGKAIAVK